MTPRARAPIALLLAAACAGPPAPPPPQPADSGNQPPPPVTNKEQARPIMKLERLANGLTVSLLPHRSGSTAQIQLGLLAGSDFGAVGLAELAAETLVRASDATNGRQSLRDVLAAMGGTLSIDINPSSTWITARVPPNNWKRAQIAMTAALETPVISRKQIERVREGYIVERIREVWTNSHAQVPRVFLLGNPGTSAYIASLLDRDASEVSLFMSRLYRPDSTIVTLQVPGKQAQIMTLLGEGLAKWPLPTGGRTQVQLEERRMQGGIHWAPSELAGPCRATLVLPLPDVDTPMAAELLTLHACLTLEGIGGRLEQLQRDRGLGHVRWQAEIIQLAEVPALALTTEATPADAVALWDVASAARQSLLDLPPTPSELRLAYRRARLTAQLLTSGAAAYGRVSTVLALRRQPPNALSLRLEALANAKVFTARAAVPVYLKRPAAMIVIGGTPPEGRTDITEFNLLPPGALARITNSNPIAQTSEAAPWLDRAIEAVGGAELLRRLRGFEAEAALRCEGAPEATEIVRWQSGTRDLIRTRKVLGTDIETRLEGTTAIEQSGNKKVKLSTAEANALRRELQRHPLNLLAACARDQLRFRPIAQRTVGDRDLMILEAVGTEFDRLRIHVDTVSHLIRVVEVWETTAEGAFVHLRDAWFDYRNSGATRAPFRRITELDDGRSRVETVYSRWQPSLQAR